MWRDWVHGFFDAAYVRMLRAQWSEALTRKQVAFAVKVLKLRRGARVLDVPCGFGRHARVLARRGMLVVGVDLSPAMLAEARRGGSHSGLVFVRGDMRRLAYQAEFDAVLNLYTSFGYFAPRENLDVLRRMARALKPGGRILIDHRDRDRDVNLPGRWWDRAHDGTLAIHDMKFDRRTSRWSGEWTFISPGGQRSVRALRHYVYTLTQWKRMFHAAGLRLTGAWSNYGERYRAGKGPRLIIAGTRVRARPLGARKVGEGATTMKKKKAKSKIVKFTARRREAMELVRFIDAHGGRLGAFRGYGAAQRPPSTSPAT